MHGCWRGAAAAAAREKSAAGRESQCGGTCTEGADSKEGPQLCRPCPLRAILGTEKGGGCVGTALPPSLAKVLNRVVAVSYT